MADKIATETAAPVLSSGVAPGRRNLRPAWRPGQSGNPKGRTPYRRLFEEALARAVTENAEALAAALVRRALEGDARMMTALLDRLTPRIARHELDAEGAGQFTITGLTHAADTRAEIERRLERLARLAEDPES